MVFNEVPHEPDSSDENPHGLDRIPLDSIRVAQESGDHKQTDAAATAIADALRHAAHDRTSAQSPGENYPIKDTEGELLSYIDASKPETLKTIDAFSKAIHDGPIDASNFDQMLAKFKCDPKQFHHFCHLLHLQGELLDRERSSGPISEFIPKYLAYTDKNEGALITGTPDLGYYKDQEHKVRSPTTLMVRPMGEREFVYKFSIDKSDKSCTTA